MGTDTIVDRDDWGTLDLVNTIEYAGRCWQDYYSQYSRYLGKGDMSLKEGGKFDIHDSHQNGLDVDVRYVRKDNQKIGLNIATAPSNYDTFATIKAMHSFGVLDNVDLIYVDSVNLGFWIEGITKNLSGHSDHFHVRIKDPD